MLSSRMRWALPSGPDRVIFFDPANRGTGLAGRLLRSPEIRADARFPVEDPQSLTGRTVSEVASSIRRFVFEVSPVLLEP